MLRLKVVERRVWSNKQCSCVGGVGDSGQTKQFFGRNTETETRPLEKAEISAETEISADTLFRPK